MSICKCASSLPTDIRKGKMSYFICNIKEITKVKKSNCERRLSYMNYLIHLTEKLDSLRVCGWFLYNYFDQLKPCPQWSVGIGSGRFPRIWGITFCCFWPTIRCHVLWLSLWWLKMNVNVSSTRGNCPLVMPTNKCGRDIARIGSGHVCWMKERSRERYVCMQRSSPSSLITN